MIQKPFLWLSLVVASLTLASCDKTTPKAPEDETKKILHEMPNRYRVTLEAVHVADDAFTTSGTIAYTSLGEPLQSIERKEQAGKGMVTISEQSDFTVRTNVTDTQRAYILRLYYYAPSDALMNNQFIDGGQDRIHQNVFAFYQNRVIVRNADLIPWLYRYCDATPAEARGTLIPSDSNPLGFVGLIRFRKASSEVTPMTIQMLHAYDSKFDAKGNPSPYYAILISKSSHGRDINFDIPLHIQD